MNAILKSFKKGVRLEISPKIMFQEFHISRSIFAFPFSETPDFPYSIPSA